MSEEKYIVNPGRSVRTDRRGTAHAGGIVTEKDFMSLSDEDRKAFIKKCLEKGGKFSLVEGAKKKVDKVVKKSTEKKAEPKEEKETEITGGAIKK